MGINDDILKAILSRDDVFLMAEKEIEKKLLKLLEAARERILGKIAKTKGEWTREWLAMMSKEITAIYDGIEGTLFDDLTAGFKDLSKDELDFIHGEFSDLPIKITMPTNKQMRAIIDLPLHDGSTLAILTGKMIANEKQALMEIIQAGMMSGDTVQQVTRQIINASELTKTQASALARTAIMHANNQANEMFFEANEDLIKAYMHVATLDTDTCLECGHLDGREYLKDEPRPQLPLHPNCRCIYTPVTYSWRELGVDKDEISSGTRASMDGQVPQNETWRDRVYKALESGQHTRLEAMLGKTRAGMLRDGVPLDKMFRDGKPLLIKDI